MFIDHESRLVRQLEKIGAVVRNGHFCCAYGTHTDTYIDHRAIFREDLRVVHQLGLFLAERLVSTQPEIVVGPKDGGADFALWVAYHLSYLRGTPVKRIALYKECDNEPTIFLFRKQDCEHFKGKRIVLVDDVINSGNTIYAVMRAFEGYNTSVVGVGTIWNRGKCSQSDFPFTELFCSLINQRLPSWNPARGECSLCNADIPVSKIHGHGLDDSVQLTLF